ncbi:hypothetical protein EXIGLDRAFT_701830 [Exidia glandulosa HHB12029]|uniref:Uncharacterized protein n=1 Tax=Exidia glandulosa HHB12029 TaxID=1314781 RepID=A0A165CUW5_EXIGL|nr:hypothetical protein EXIGLDRAFT_701830 [Exidia glandulosa HHB12029]
MYYSFTVPFPSMYSSVSSMSLSSPDHRDDKRCLVRQLICYFRRQSARPSDQFLITIKFPATVYLQQTAFGTRRAVDSETLATTRCNERDALASHTKTMGAFIPQVRFLGASMSTTLCVCSEPSVTALLGTRSSLTRSKCYYHEAQGGQFERARLSSAATYALQPAVRPSSNRVVEGGNDLSETLSRAKFEELNMDLSRKTMKPVEQVLKNAGVASTSPNLAALLSVVWPTIMVIYRNGVGEGQYANSNLDEAVAYGAAGTDVNPLILDVETIGGVFIKLIPTSKKQIFSTAADNQNTVLIQRVLIKDNTLFGKFGFGTCAESITIPNEKAQDGINRMFREAEEYARGARLSASVSRR